MKGLIRYFADRHLLVNIITFTIIVLGFTAMMNAKRDLWPEVDFDQVTITTRYPGASPEDVELNVTNKIEEELQGVDGIDEMTSYSQYSWLRFSFSSSSFSRRIVPDIFCMIL